MRPAYRYLDGRFWERVSGVWTEVPRLRMRWLVAHRRRRVHRCGNCVLWMTKEGSELGICDIGSLQPLPGFDGNGVETDDGFRTTPETYCDYQVPIPPPGPPCPKCGADTVEGFGLMGGGYGPYELCEAPGCDYFQKWEEMPEDDA